MTQMGKYLFFGPPAPIPQPAARKKSPLYACGKWVDLPHLAKRAFRDQISPNVQKAMLLGSPSHQGLKN